MKNIIATIILLASFSLLSAQDWRSSSAIQGTGNIIVLRADTSTTGNIYVLGYFEGTIEPGTANEATSYFGRDYFLGKFDTDGLLQWIKHIASPQHVFIYAGLAVDVNENIYVSGSFRDYVKISPTDSIFSSGLFDSFVAKYDANGNPILLERYGTSSTNVRSVSAVIDNNGNLVLSGTFKDSVQFNNGLTLRSDDGIDDYFYGNFDPVTLQPNWVKQILGIDNLKSGQIFEISTSPEAYYMTGLYADSIGFENDTIVSYNHSYDVHIIKTDYAGDIQWMRTINGNISETSWAITVDSDESVYFAGWFDSTTPSGGLTIDSTETTTINRPGSAGSDDIFIGKYDTNGTLQWFKTAGGKSTDKVYDIVVYGEVVYVIGIFSDTLNWGGIEFTTHGPDDQDMFFGSLTLDGKFSSANSIDGYFSAEESAEEGRAIFKNNDDLLAVLATNASQIEMESGKFYFNASRNYFVIVGVVGCLPISISNVIKTNVTSCYGDCNGSIIVTAGDAGFGNLKYSINNNPGQTSPAFSGLCAGNYTVTMYDQAGCLAEYTANPVVISQPAKIVVTGVDSTDVLCNGESTGTITVTATGGTGNLTFTHDGGTTYTSAGSPASVPVGTYFLTVKDANDCFVVSDTVIIREPTILTISTTDSTDALCFDADGSISLVAEGGLGTYHYSVDAGTTSQAESTIAVKAGTYYAAVLDDNGCLTLGDTIYISQPDEVTIALLDSSNILEKHRVISLLRLQAEMESMNTCSIRVPQPAPIV